MICSFKEEGLVRHPEASSCEKPSAPLNGRKKGGQCPWSQGELGPWRTGCRGPWSLTLSFEERHSTEAERRGKEPPDLFPLLPFRLQLVPPPGAGQNPAIIWLAREVRDRVIRSQHPRAQIQEEKYREWVRGDKGGKANIPILGGKKNPQVLPVHSAE